MGFLDKVKGAVTGGALLGPMGGFFGGLSDSGFLGGGEVDNTSTVTNLPWNTKDLQFLMEEARKIYDEGPLSYYPQSTVAGLDPRYRSALNSMMGFSGTPNVQAGQGALDTSLGGFYDLYNQAAGEQVSGIGDYATYLMGLGQTGDGGRLGAIASGEGAAGQALSDLLAAPGANPYIDQIISQVGNDLSTNLNERIMPRIDQGALAANQYGGSRQGLAQGKAIDATQKQFADAAERIRYGDYTDTQNRRLNAAGLAGNIASGADSYENAIRQLGLAGADLGRGLFQDLSGVTGKLGSMGPLLQAFEGQNLNTMLQGGSTYQNYLQALRDDSVNRFNFDQTADRENLDYLSRILLGAGGLGGTQTTTTPTPEASGAERLLGGASTGLGAYLGLAGTAAGPYALPISLALGGLSALT